MKSLRMLLLQPLLLQLGFATSAYAARNFDQRSFLELSTFAYQVETDLKACADSQNLLVSELYYKKLSTCPDTVRQSLKNLKDSFKLFTLSSLVENYGQIQNREKISPLLIQIISENISGFKLDEVKPGGGTSGFGICTPGFSLGICTTTTSYEISPVIREEHMAYLRLFDLIPESQCEIGLYPVATVTLISEIAEAQGLIGNKVRNDVIVMGGTFMMGSHIREMNESKPSSQLIRRLDGKFKRDCGLIPMQRSGAGTAFFQGLVDSY